MKRMAVFLLVGFAWPCLGQKYTHQLLLSGFQDWAGGGFLNERGDWAIGLWNQNGQDQRIYMDGAQFTFPAGITKGYPRGLNDNGDLLIEGTGTTVRNGLQTVYKNTTRISNLFHPEFGGDSAIDINNAGQVLWEKIDFGSSYILRDSTRVDKYGSLSTAEDMNEVGDVIWDGPSATDPNNYKSLFINATTVYTTNVNQIFDARINDNGIWAGSIKVGPAQNPHIFMDGIDLTDIVFPNDNLATASAFGVTTSGQVWWLGLTFGDPAFLNRFYLDSTDVSTGLLPPDYYILDAEMNDHGILFMVANPRTNGSFENIFVNNFNLTQDLFGPSFGGKSGTLQLFDVNNRGQILWGYTPNVSNANWSIYLSTPVPEPALCVIPAILILAFKRRQCSGRRRSL